MRVLALLLAAVLARVVYVWTHDPEADRRAAAARAWARYPVPGA